MVDKKTAGPPTPFMARFSFILIVVAAMLALSTVSIDCTCNYREALEMASEMTSFHGDVGEERWRVIVQLLSNLRRYSDYYIIYVYIHVIEFQYNLK